MDVGDVLVENEGGCDASASSGEYSAEQDAFEVGLEGDDAAEGVGEEGESGHECELVLVSVAREGGVEEVGRVPSEQRFETRVDEERRRRVERTERTRRGEESTSREPDSHRDRDELLHRR